MIEVFKENDYYKLQLSNGVVKSEYKLRFHNNDWCFKSDLKVKLKNWWPHRQDILEELTKFRRKEILEKLLNYK